MPKIEKGLVRDANAEEQGMPFTRTIASLLFNAAESEVDFDV